MSEDVKLREQQYVDPRPPETFTRYHEQVRRGEANLVYEAVRLTLTPYMLLVLRNRQIGVENVPGSGPLILAPNHFSFMDHFLVGCLHPPAVHFMAKSQLFKSPADLIYRHGGVYPGDARRPRRRGLHDDRGDPRPRRHDLHVLRGGAIAGPAKSPRRPGRGSAGSRSKAARRSYRSRSSAPRRSATGSACSFRASRSSTASRCIWEQTDDPTREQQQAVADAILDQIRAHVRRHRSGTDARPSSAATANSAALAAPRWRSLRTGQQTGR